MRLHTDARVVAIVAVLLAVPASGAAASGQPDAATVDAESPEQAEITSAIEKVKADPNLATEGSIKMLQWNDPAEPRKPLSMPTWLNWIGGLFRWLEQSARVLLWSAVAVMAAMLVVYIIRIVRRHGGPLGGDEAFVAPTHVRDLDIRPETLPSDIGAAARVLWDRGERRASLALLYRGMLSRLAHVHRVPIRDSSTEGDCLVLAARHLAQQRQEYTSSLVRVWQRFVYGGDEVPTTIVHVLCDDFASALDSVAPPLDSLASGGAA